MLDLFLDNAATGMGKRVQAMETPRDHCRPLNRLTTKQVRERNEREERIQLVEVKGWVTERDWVVSLMFEERVKRERERKDTVRLRGTTKISRKEGEVSAVSKAKS